MNLEGTTALVTGSARRVGRAIALELARGGCDVVVHYRRSRAEADTVVSEIIALGRRSAALAADLSDAEQWPGLIGDTIAAFGRLDILVNNASEFLGGGADTIAEFDVERWERMLRINLTAAAALCHHAAPHLAAHGAGRIVNISDISAQRPWPQHIAYCISKAGLEALTQALARALAPKINVNAVAPGIAVFPESYSPAVRAELTARVPLAREGAPDDIARAVRYLVEHGDYITGEVLRVDGGRHLA